MGAIVSTVQTGEKCDQDKANFIQWVISGFSITLP